MTRGQKVVLFGIILTLIGSIISIAGVRDYGVLEPIYISDLGWIGIAIFWIGVIIGFASYLIKDEKPVSDGLPSEPQSNRESEKEAKESVFGYMVLNDTSARDIQAKDKQFTRAKGFDTFAPCGPWITTSDEIPDPQNLKMMTKVNGNIRQNSSTSNMHLTVYSIVSQLSKAMTLEKGDIISTGTPAGVMLNKPDAVFLKDGDKIEMEIENLGKLQNTVRFV